MRDDFVIIEGEKEARKLPGSKLLANVNLSKKQLISLIVAVLVVGGLIGGATVMNRYNALKEENKRLSNPQEAARLEANRLKDEVAAIYELPNETPTIATVVDATKLKDQAFFANAQNGDRVLMFPQAKKAILYRPSTKKIIEVAPINIGDTSSTESQNPTTQSGTTQGASTNQAPATNTRR